MGQCSPAKSTCTRTPHNTLYGRTESGARFFTCSKEGTGSFEMKMMSPGKYWIVAHDEIKLGKSTSKSTLYYPGVRDRDHASAIEIEAGKYLDHLNIQIPAD